MKNRIKELRLLNNMTLLEVAKALGVAESTAQRYESGAIENLKYETMVSLANLYKVSPAYLMGWDDSPSAPLFEAAAGEGRLNDGYPTEVYKIQLEPEEFSFRVCGRSMEPTLLDGDIAIVTAQNVIDYPRQIALIKVNGEESTLKRVEIKENGVTLIADNTDVYPPHFYTDKEVEQLPVSIEGVLTKLIREFK